MHSIRTKIAMLTVSAIIAAMTVSAALATFAIRDYGNNASNQILYLLCETGEKNLDSYFQSVEQSVETVSSYAQSDLEKSSLDSLDSHIARVETLFEKIASNTSSILTYYYRIDPAISQTSKGFWYVDIDGSGFQSHEVTDITLYDTNDTSKLVWFTVPKATGNSIWLPPYFTDNLDVCVLSYNIPIYKSGTFIGVIGIEVDYYTIAEQVNNITLYESGYAFINDNDGNIIYHPKMDMKDLTGGKKYQVPNGILSDSTYIRYKYDGIDKQAVWLPLSNGMRLNVTVPVKEISKNWNKMLAESVIVSVVLILIFSLLTVRLTKRITRPLKNLTDAAKQMDAGNYDVELDYDGDDEVGILVKAFNHLTNHLRNYISDLNSLAYADALTSVHNKRAFDIFVHDMQKKINSSDKPPEFAVGIFDCDNLKIINDKYGHIKGNTYLKTACSLICKVFKYSPVYRIGGDEFAVLLQNDDYVNRDELIRLFEKRSAEISGSATDEWKKISISMGFAVYDRRIDHSVSSVIRRADAIMYDNKQKRKTKQYL